MQLATRDRRAHAVLAVGGRFDKYQPEDEKDARKVTIERDPVLERLIAIWKKFELGFSGYNNEYKDALEQVKGISYSAKDVEKFSIALLEFQDEGNFPEKAGYFISVLINNGKDLDYVIHTQHLNQEINLLGYRNSKNITVNGNVGRGIGWEMEGGSITVNGNAGKRVGQGMKDGEIHLQGDYVTLAGDIKGGKIYHKGKLIFGREPD